MDESQSKENSDKLAYLPPSYVHQCSVSVEGRADYQAALLYVVWNNGGPQPAMGYWLKSFNKKPPPVPGKSYTVPQINNCKPIHPETFMPD
jgi:hypothetical protein